MPIDTDSAELREITSQHVRDEVYPKGLEEPIDSDPTIPFMNVGSSVDLSMRSPTALYIEKKAASRAVGLMTGPHCVHPILDICTPVEFLAYQSELRGYSIHPLLVNFENLQNGFPLHQVYDMNGATLKPYIATPQLLTEARSVGLTVAGWNENNIHLSLLLNTKSSFHKLFRSADVELELVMRQCILAETHIVPNSFEVTKDKLAQIVAEKVEEYQKLYRDLEPQIKAFYEQHGIAYRPHMAGVMIRPCWGSGGLESCSVLKSTRNRGYILRIEGKSYTCSALEEIQAIIDTQLLEDGSCDTYLVTRFLDICESPSFHFILGDEWCYVPSAVEQIINNALFVGTTSVSPHEEKKLYYAGAVSSSERVMLLEQARCVTAYSARLMHRQGLRGQHGIDVMLTGFFEQAFATAVKGTLYEDEAVGPVVLAEANVRLTVTMLQRYMMLSILKTIAGTSQEAITYKELIRFTEETGRTLHFICWNDYAVSSSVWNRLINNRTILAGINGTSEGIYILRPPIDGEWASMAVGIMARDRKTLNSYQEILKLATCLS